MTPKIQNNERKRRLMAIKAHALTTAERTRMMLMIDRGDETIRNYLDGRGSNYHTEMAVIEAGEEIIKSRAAKAVSA